MLARYKLPYQQNHVVATRVDFDRRWIVNSGYNLARRIHLHKDLSHERAVAEGQCTAGVPEAPGAVDVAIMRPR